MIARRQPRKPSIGLNSCRDAAFLATSSGEIPRAKAISCLVVESFGRNSWSGGSRSLMFAGSPWSSVNMASKSPLCIGRSSARAAFLSMRLFARIIFLMETILEPPKNMCSVLQRPIPSAPSMTAMWVSAGVSALVLTPIVLMSST